MTDSESALAVGHVLYLHDHVTRFSMKDRYRWCVVIAIVGGDVRVGGRSTTRQDGVALPKTAMAEFDKDGWIPAPALRISRADAEAAKNIGPLPDHYLQQVLFFLNEDLP